MQHLDDGVLNALLDGELTALERAEADRHLAQCAGCRDRLAEARELMAEADGLVAGMELPAPTPPAGRGPSPASGEPAGGAGLRPRRVDYRALAWAATIVLALATGYLGGARLRAPQASAPPETTESANRAPELPAAGPDRRQAESPVPPAGTEARRPALSQADSPATVAAKSQPATAILQLEEADTTPAVPAALSLRSRVETTIAARPGRADEAATYIDGVPANPGYRRNAFARTAGEAAARAAAPAADRPTIRDVQDFGHIGWDTAIAVLGGSIRLIDGQAPVALDLASAGEAAGLETGRPVVRIRYLLGGRDTVDLLEQRVSAMRQERKTIGDSAMVFQAEALPGGGAQVRWEMSGGFLLVLRSALTADRLLELAAQVR